jgi:hypothetical protein
MMNLKEYILQNIDKSESMKRQMIEYLLAIHNFNSFEDFQDVVSTMIEVDQYQTYYNEKIIELIRDIFKQEIFPKEQIREFIKTYLQESIPLGERYSIYYTLYQYFKEPEYFNFPINEQELKDICFMRMEKFVNLNVKDLDKCMNLYYLCRENVDPENRVILQERAHNLMREFISMYPWDYIDSLIRPYGTPIHRSFEPAFTIEPFVEKTFGGWGNFWIFLDGYKPTISEQDKQERFDKYYLFFERFKDNGYKPVLIYDKEWEYFAIDKLIEEKKWNLVG